MFASSDLFGVRVPAVSGHLKLLDFQHFLGRDVCVPYHGENKLPPIGPVGLAVHGIRGRSLTLEADSAKLAKLIAQRVVTGQFGP
jgi:hypothetical protein